MQATHYGKLAAVLGVILAVVIIVGLMFALPTYSRYQARANARNNVSVSAIQIQNQAQLIKVAQQQAQIKKQTAIGQKLANEEIAKRLTPLFVQYEMIQALEAIAQSGRNNTVIYIPSGASGVPLISDTGKAQIYQGQSKP